jgi:hypothetical protein
MYSNKMHHQRQHSQSRVLSIVDADTLLSSFPTTRLSYEVSIHKNDAHQSAANEYKCFILPKGRRCIAWATEWKQRMVFALIEIDGANNGHGHGHGHGNGHGNEIRPAIRKFHQDCGWFPGKVYIYDACFDRTLAYGTVFGGVMFRSTTGPAQLFSIHTIYWYKGNAVPPLTGLEHIQLSEELFFQNNIRQVAYTKENSVIFGLPILCNNEYDAQCIAGDLPYQVFAIQYRYLKHTRVYQKFIQDRPRPQPKPQPQTQPQPSSLSLNVHTTQSNDHQYQRGEFIPPPDEMLTNIQTTFIVRPNLQNDVYELFVIPDNSRAHSSSPVFHNFAHIPSYKTSVMMNRLFRKIAENASLDALEESEDETDFENTEPDKYVSLSKEYRMVCRFNKRFCKWVPIEINHRGSDIATIQQVKQHESRYMNFCRNK